MTPTTDIKTIGLWIGIWLLGYGLGLFEAWVKDKRRKNKEAKKEAEIIEKIVYLPSPDGEQDYILALEETNTGTLQLKLDGETIDSPASMEPQHRKRLIELLVAIRPWIETKTASAPTKVPPKPVSTPSLSSAGISAARSIPTSPEGVAIEKEHEEQVDEKLGMVAQIDRILQHKLEGHPFEKTEIRLKESLTGGVIFHVGVARYEFIDEIPDKGIQDLINAATKEWENTSTPGL